MTTHRRPTQALSVLAQMACLGVPGDALLDELMRALRDLVPFEGWSYLTYDAQGHFREERPSANVAQPVQAAYIARWYENGENDLYAPQLRERLSRRLYDCVRLSHVVPRLRHTAYHDEILQPMDLRDVARTLLRDGSRLLGRMTIARGQRDFSDAEIGLLRQALPHLSHALARQGGSHLGSKEEASTEHAGESALLVVDAQGRIQSSAPHAWTLLHRAAGNCLVLDTLVDSTHAWAQPFLASLVQRMQALLLGEPGHPPLVVQRNRYGTFHLRGYVLDAGGGAPALYGIQIERRVTLEQRLFGSPRFRGLTASEREVALRLARGAAPGEIAQDLGVKTSTAIFHTRNIYRQLEINQRAQLVSALLA